MNRRDLLVGTLSSVLSLALLDEKEVLSKTLSNTEADIDAGFHSFYAFLKTRYLREQRFDILERLILTFKNEFPNLNFPSVTVDNKINPYYIPSYESKYTYYSLIPTVDKDGYWLMVHNDSKESNAIMFRV